MKRSHIFYKIASGFYTERRGEAEICPPRNLGIEYAYYCGAINITYLILHVTGHKYHQNAVWKVRPALRQKQSERM